jgi:hypothetical protein
MYRGFLVFFKKNCKKLKKNEVFGEILKKILEI